MRLQKSFLQVPGEEGKFVRRRIRLGPEFYVVLEGLRAGDILATKELPPRRP
jgi:hypothetical protein